MLWITGIKLDNYRAFAECKIIKIPFGQHLLIYGENGSGKSSIYRALHDFFSSSWQNSLEFTTNVFEQTRNDGVIEINISNNESAGDIAYLFAKPNENTTTGNPKIKLAAKLRGFLDYKQILKAHALDVPNKERPDIFGFLFNDLLCNHRIPSPAGGASTVEVGRFLTNLKNTLSERRRNATAWKNAQAQLPIIDSALKNLLRNVFTIANYYLNGYFKNSISLDFNYKDLAITSYKALIGKTVLLVKYAGKEIDSYHFFLNEARLSALSVCLYLAAIKTNPVPEDALKILFLDDVFIGLDTSNRLPLLNIIKNEFIDSGFQVFISTYDRHFFEITRNWFSTQNIATKSIEMFIGKHSDPLKPDYPVIVDPSHDYYERALSHFLNHDYPAAANCLRKECEKQLKRILPANFKLSPDHTNGTINTIDNLETLVNNFFDFLQANNLDSEPYKHFRTYKKIILNPLSHDDLEAPHYRSEIEGGIALAEALNNLEVKEIVLFKNGVMKPLKLGSRDTTTDVMHHYEFHFKENLRIVKQGGQPPVFLRNKFALVLDGNSRPFDKIYDAFDCINAERGYPPSTDYTVFYTNISVTNKKKLAEFMQFT